jgi:hypothetical protein
MPIEQGTHTLGPSNARLAVHTVAAGTVARVGHDLSIEVGSWSGTLELAEEGASVTLTADGGSLRVLEGHGGMKELDDDDRANIGQTIDDEVLKRTPIEFRSSTVEPAAGGDRLRVEGDLELAGSRHPIAFELTLQESGRLAGSARIKQSDWGIKPYSALFGALKVADEVEVTIDGDLTSTQTGAG